MNPKDLNHYSGVVNQPPLRWGRMKKWLFHISHAPSYAPEPEQKPVSLSISTSKLVRSDILWASISLSSDLK